MASPAVINCPQIVNVTADGTANLELIKLEGFALDNADATFVVEAEVTNEVFAGFSIADGPGPDASANPVVSMTDDAAFSAALKALAVAAKLSTDSTKDMSAWLLSEAKTNIESRLNENGISSTAEAEKITDMAHAGFGDDVKAGTDTMAAALKNNADKLNLLLVQFPKSRFDASDNAIEELPYQVGDKFVVQFVATQEIDLTSGSTYLDITGALGTSGTQLSKVTKYAIASRTVNLEITVKA